MNGCGGQRIVGLRMWDETFFFWITSACRIFVPFGELGELLFGEGDDAFAGDVA